MDSQDNAWTQLPPVQWLCAPKNLEQPKKQLPTNTKMIGLLPIFPKKTMKKYL